MTGENAAYAIQIPLNSEVPCIPLTVSLVQLSKTASAVILGDLVKGSDRWLFSVGSVTVSHGDKYQAGRDHEGAENRVLTMSTHT
jgi:hypothetical protein